MKRLSVLCLLILLVVPLAAFAGETTAGEHLTIGTPLVEVSPVQGTVLAIDAQATPAVFAARRTGAPSTVTTALMIASADQSIVILTQSTQLTAAAPVVNDPGRWATMPTRVTTATNYRTGRHRSRSSPR